MTVTTPSQTVTLGPQGPTIPALGVGTWAWGDSLFWSYGKDYTEGDLQGAFAAAIAAGTPFFDTAEIYGFGESERLLGRFLQGMALPQRQGVAISTKYFPLPWRFTPDAVAQALAASLERLQCTTIDLYQIHWPLDFFLGQQAMMAALAAAVQRGQIRAVGVSNYSAQQMRTAHRYLGELGVPLGVNQVQYSLLHRTIETNGVLETARELGVVILAYSPLAQGLLTGKYRSQGEIQPQGARKISPQFSAKGLAKIEPLLTTLDTLAMTYGKTPAQVALNWLVEQGNVVPIPGAKNPQQASQNAGALGWALSPADRDRLGTALA